MTTWSKSPAAIEARARRAKPQLLHYSALAQPGKHYTMCGREIVSNSSMWVGSIIEKTTCPRCLKEMTGKSRNSC